jgi:hypothetical protein
VRQYFGIHAVVDGKDQGVLDRDAHIVDIAARYEEQLAKSWGETQDNGFIYQVDTNTLDQYAIKSPLQDHQVRKGIGHQRSKSSPAVASGVQNAHDDKEVKAAPIMETGRPRSFSQSTDEKHPLEKRTATPNREMDVAIEEKDEAKGLGISTAPHLEPRTPVSPSPPRASIRTRSKTIAFSTPPIVPGLTIKPTSGAPSPLASPTLPRSKGVPQSPRTIACWEDTLPKGGSLGRSAGTARVRRTTVGIFDEDGNDPREQGPSTKGRSTSPPPPRQRYTPPPTILSPMVGAVLGAVPTAASPSIATRHRAQTTGSKQAPHKWVKVRATKTGSNTVGSTGVGDVLLLTLERLKGET